GPGERHRKSVRVKRARFLLTNLFLAAVQRGLQGFQNELDVFGSGTVAHGADAEDFAGQWAEAPGDFHTVLFEQELANLGVVHAVRNARGIERPEAVALRYEHRQAEFLDAGDEGLVVGLVARPTGFEPFLGDDGQPFA